MSQYLISTVLIKCLNTVVVFSLQKLQCILILNKFRTLDSTVQVLEMIWMLNELIQANEMVFMNFWYIEHYGAWFGEGIDAKMNYYNHTKW